MKQDFKEELNNVLMQSTDAAKEGMDIAASQKENVKMVLDKVMAQKNGSHLFSQDMKVPPVYSAYQQKLYELQHTLRTIYREMDEKFYDYRQDLSSFTITVFGKTTVGKSTLMETLIHGKGDSIGKGAQRTTRDVRRYVWDENHIEFVDVPGICAAKSGGLEDSKKAFDAVRTADLVLFLITDDGPQEEEAAALAKIRSMGKPVICILNVKACGADNDFSFKLRLHSIEKRMTHTNDFSDIKKQFYAYAPKYGDDWSDIPFVYADLHTAWLSEQPEYQIYSQTLYQLSRFETVTDTILREICQHGILYQFRTPIDIICHTLRQVDAEMRGQIQASSQLMVELNRSYSQLQQSRKEYQRYQDNRIQRFLTGVADDLKSRASVFVEDHYEDEKAGARWEQVVRQAAIEKRIKKMLEELTDEEQRRLEKFYYSIPDATGIQVQSLKAKIEGNSVYDTRFWMDAGGLVAIAFVFPGFWAALIAGTIWQGITWLLTDSKADKEKKRKKAMRDALYYWIDGTGKGEGQKNQEIFVQQLARIIDQKKEIIFKPFLKTQDVYDQLIRCIRQLNKEQQDMQRGIESILNYLQSEISRRVS